MHSDRGGERLQALLREHLDPVPTLGTPPRSMIGDGVLGEAPVEIESPVPAGVLVPLVMHAGGPTVLLTQRTEHLDKHAGQISFPGGRVETIDPDYAATALRETHEEIGLSHTHVEIVGSFEECHTGTGFRIVPVVGLVRPGFTLTLDSFEVSEAFEVPLAVFLDRANHQRRRAVFRGREREFYVIEHGERYIWGATAAMLVNLVGRLERAGLRQTD